MASHEDDREWVLEVLKGNTDAFAALEQRYRSMVTAIAGSRLGNRDDVQDAVQEAMLKAFLRVGELRDPDKFGPWLRRIAENECARVLRQRKHPMLSLSDIPEEVMPGTRQGEEEAALAALAVREALSRLPERARRTATLFYIDGCSYTEIARTLGVPVNTVHSRLRSAKRRLRKEILLMVTVSSEVAARMLKSERLKYVGELMSLERQVPPVPTTVFGDAEHPCLVMLVQEWPNHYRCATVTGYGEDFARDCVTWLAGSFKEFRLISPERAVFDLIAREGLAEMEDVRVVRRMARPDPGSASGVGLEDVCRLTTADLDAARRYPAVRSRGPNLPELLEMPDIEDVYAIRAGSDILGFLAAVREYEDIWDVDMVHVREGSQNQGLGTKLLRAYARDVSQRGGIPYLSAAETPACERAAQKAGFAVCAEAFWTDLRPGT